MIEIKNRLTGEVIFTVEGDSLKIAVLQALKSKVSLRGADLSGADLRGADLRGASLRDANLRDASLSGADLSGADLRDASLRGADLRDASLSGADLSDANLSGADLSDANLSGANLSGASLRGADLRDASLRGANLQRILNQRTILPAGDLIVWKKLQDGVICKLSIPADAKRVGGLCGRKCRAEYAIVLEGEGIARHDGKTVYKVGETIRADSYDENPLIECSHGIHFMITQQEAIDY